MTSEAAPHLTIADLAEREQVSVETVRTWNRTRSGPPYIKAGRHVRYRIADVEAWEDSRTVAAAGPGDAPCPR
jgi:predicted DNA-binding transcriptional regulator AlpA